jgi:hypothetical protein
VAAGSCVGRWVAEPARHVHGMAHTVAPLDKHQYMPSSPFCQRFGCFCQPLLGVAPHDWLQSTLIRHKERRGNVSWQHLPQSFQCPVVMCVGGGGGDPSSPQQILPRAVTATYSCSSNHAQALIMRDSIGHCTVHHGEILCPTASLHCARVRLLLTCPATPPCSRRSRCAQPARAWMPNIF